MSNRPRSASIMVPLLGILLIAINLRPVITAVGPVLPALGEELSLGPSALGLLGALPIAMFALVSVTVQSLVARFGVVRTTAGALALLTVATVLRSWPGAQANLWLGTALLGAAIAVGNVAVPVIVKQSFPRATALVTSIYVAVLGVFAGLAAALAVPLANTSTLGWRLSLGAWAILTFCGLLFWLTRALRSDNASHERAAQSASVSRQARRASLWHNPVAWQLSAYMGVQSGVFYMSLTWLPTVEQAFGVDPVATGLHMFVLQVAAVVANLLAPALMRIGNDQRVAAILPGVLMLIGLVGIFAWPPLMVLWVSVLGFGTGVSFVVALSLIAMRATSITTASRLSSIVQSIGYTIAALGLYVAGVVQGLSAPAVLGVISCMAVAVAVMGAYAGRDRVISDCTSAT